MSHGTSTMLDESWKIPARMNNAFRLARGELRAPLAQTPHQVVARWGRVELLRYETAEPRRKCPVLMVPSVINRHYVMDLRPGQSYVEHLCGQGIPVYMLTWGDPGPQDRFAGLEDHILKWLHAAVRRACKDAGVEKIHLLGYCAGGTFAIAYTALRPKHVAGLIALTAPCKFRAGEGTLADWARCEHMPAERIVERMGLIPGSMLQSSFLIVQPGNLPRKLRTFTARLWDEKFVENFVALETWLNDSVDLPGKLYIALLRDFYQGDKLVKGELLIGGERVDLGAIQCPVLTVIATRDHIVPDPSARILHDMVGSKDRSLLALDGGHIGVSVGRKARTGLWRHTHDWLMDRPCLIE